MSLLKQNLNSTEKLVYLYLKSNYGTEARVALKEISRKCSISVKEAAGALFRLVEKGCIKKEINGLSVIKYTLMEIDPWL